jgi:hypothetical protein
LLENEDIETPRNESRINEEQLISDEIKKPTYNTSAQLQTITSKASGNINRGESENSKDDY